jgi:hypothetical protein
MRLKIQDYENTSLQKTLLQVKGQTVLVAPCAVDIHKMTAVIERLCRGKDGVMQAWVPEASSHVNVVLADLVIENGQDYDQAMWALT